jgi:predicted GNAT family N-acyltransferase
LTQRLIRLDDWHVLEPMLRRVRTAVFIAEQGVPEVLEWDEHDAESLHAVALIDGEVAGCARLLPDGHIGRMAVLPDFRGQGVGSEMLVCLIDAARARNMTLLQLHAQSHAAGFYRKAGFVSDGPEFDEAGIPHIRMLRTVAI